MPLEPGDKAPDFTLTSDAGEKVRLADFKGRRVILYFYPKQGTPGCTTEACDFAARRDEATRAGAAIVGVSPDSPSALAGFRTAQNLNFTLLSDPDHAVAEKYGAWGEKSNYGKTYMGIIRSTFVIGADGRIEQAMYNVRAAGHAARVLASLAS